MRIQLFGSNQDVRFFGIRKPVTMGESDCQTTEGAGSFIERISSASALNFWRSGLHPIFPPTNRVATGITEDKYLSQISTILH